MAQSLKNEPGAVLPTFVKHEWIETGQCRSGTGDSTAQTRLRTRSGLLFRDATITG